MRLSWMAKKFIPGPAAFGLAVAGPLCLFLVSLAAPAWTADDGSQRLMSLKAALSGISGLSGDFVQEKHLPYLKKPIRSQGFFRFSKPDSLYWEYLSPAQSGLEIKGGQVRAWSGPPEDRKSQPEAMAKAARLAAEQVLLWMNLDPEAIMAAYSLETISEKPLRLRLLPKRAAARKLIKSLSVEFNADLRTVRQVSLEEAEGRTDISFSRVRLNPTRP